MKKQPIFKLVLLVCIGVLALNCTNDDDNQNNIPADTYTSLSSLVEALKEEPQSHDITDPSVATVITGDDGTIFNIGPNAFTDDDNNVITTPVVAKLTEYLTLDKMFLNNAQTSSNGQLLITGGSFNLTFEDENGNPVNANPFNIQAQMTIQTDTTGLGLTNMDYYVGSVVTQDGREVVNWDLNQQNENWFNDGYFNILGLEQGLSNCDVLYDMAGETATQFEVSVSDVTDYSQTTVWMFIEDFPSVVMITSLNDAETALETYAGSIPLGLNATLLAITIDENSYLKFGSLPITVEGDDTFNVTVDYGTTEELTQLVSSIVN
ncbi:hypothetical protein DMZ43_09570 [Meridianimaribacter sp. CL38]|uniref:hypothetical protein n=1 Tax=Meridianimaribacter sp. CL38 TaxID=2213021 RepID=UPI001040AA9C|nr:hypothetical protein [Meridianimaribacter sp. CL38]TBV26140.1 hypothetical protein DMZ43_09570 [Meridianimaribacter sp. CL38]